MSRIRMRGRWFFLCSRRCCDMAIPLTDSFRVLRSVHRRTFFRSYKPLDGPTHRASSGPRATESASDQSGRVFNRP